MILRSKPVSCQSIQLVRGKNLHLSKYIGNVYEARAPIKWASIVTTFFPSIIGGPVVSADGAFLNYLSTESIESSKCLFPKGILGSSNVHKALFGIDRIVCVRWCAIYHSANKTRLVGIFPAGNVGMS